MTGSEMLEIPAGGFRMGSADFYPEESPVHTIDVRSFAIDRGPVTVAEFARFVEDTGYVTFAERAPDPAEYPDADPSLLVAGSAVFHPTPHPVPLNDPSRWWAYVPGASWRHPWGPASDNSERQDHPVTHVAYEDAQAFAEWAGKELPTEAECRGNRPHTRHYAEVSAGVGIPANPPWARGAPQIGPLLTFPWVLSPWSWWA